MPTGLLLVGRSHLAILVSRRPLAFELAADCLRITPGLHLKAAAANMPCLACHIKGGGLQCRPQNGSSGTWAADVGFIAKADLK